MENITIKQAADILFKHLPKHFGDIFFDLNVYQTQVGMMSFTVNGMISRRYFYSVSLDTIKDMFKWLESILDSPYTENHDFYMANVIINKSLIIGYLPYTNVDKTYRESRFGNIFPEIPMKECGMFYVYDIETDVVLESAFIRYEYLVRKIYTSIKKNKQIEIESKRIESFLLSKDQFCYEYKGIICKCRVEESDLRLYGEFYDSDKTVIQGYGIWADCDTEFLDLAEVWIERIIANREYKRKNEEWKMNNDVESIGCVVHIMPEIFKQRIINGEYDKSLNNVVRGGDYEVPLPFVTKAWDYLLKGTLCTNEFRVEYEAEYDSPAGRTREEALHQNDQMKIVWKELLGIDVDALDVDFSKFDKHLPPKVSEEFSDDYFQAVPYGIEEWILEGINYPSGMCSYDFVSSLMEFCSYIGRERETWIDS